MRGRGGVNRYLKRVPKVDGVPIRKEHIMTRADTQTLKKFRKADELAARDVLIKLAKAGNWEAAAKLLSTYHLRIVG